MKVLVIPDPHQTRVGIEKAKAEIDNVDKVVVLGDYVDNWESEEWWNIPELNPLNTIKEWVSFKKCYPEKVDLLFGNHDMGYLSDSNISGHQHLHHSEIREAFMDNLSYFDIAVKYGDFVFSHAGISSYWVPQLKQFNDITDYKSIVPLINNLFHSHLFKIFDFNTDCWDASGNSVNQGPLWIRPPSLWRSMDLFKKQVVGHTECPQTEIDGDKMLKIVDSPNHDHFEIMEIENEN